MKTFIQFYAENNEKADVDAYYRFVAPYFHFSTLKDLFFGILNGGEFVGEGFAFTLVNPESNKPEIMIHRYSSDNNYTKIREAIGCYPIPDTINDLFALLYNLMIGNQELYAAWEKAYELRKKVNLQSLVIEV